MNELAKIDGVIDSKDVMFMYGLVQKVSLAKSEMDEIIERDIDATGASQKTILRR